MQTATSPTLTAPTSENLNLELLHHFTISTAPTLSHDSQIRELWRVVVPQMSFATDYVLDGILALAALHVARYNKSRRASLLPYAIERHSQSLSRAFPLVPSITPQNSAPLFIFGMLTLYFNLARPIEDDPEQVGNSVIPEWLYLLHGIDTVTMAEGSAVRESPVSLIFRTTWGSLEYWLTHTPEKYESLEDLQERIQEETVDDLEKRTILCDSISALSRSYSFLYGQKFPDPDQLRGFWQWLFEIKEPYLNLVKSGDNAALCVLAFYAVLLKDLEKYWWMEGRAVNLLRSIYMMLDGGHRLWIRWAIEQVGWIPEAI